MDPTELSVYLQFLDGRAELLQSGKSPREEDLRIINIEINKLLERFAQSPTEDSGLLAEVAKLKIDFDERRPLRKHWGVYMMIYGLLGYFPGALVVWAREKHETARTKDILAEFRRRVTRISTRIESVDAQVAALPERPCEIVRLRNSLSFRLIAFGAILICLLLLLIRGR